MAKLQIILYVALITLFHAEASAVDGSLRVLENRADYYGGFSLNFNLATTCPAGTFSCDPYTSGHLSGGPCCPLHTVCSSSSDYCCPTSADCSEAVNNAPTCADPSWTLLTESTFASLCCLSGMVLDDAAQCVTLGAAGESSQVTYYTSQTQANNASPTGDGTGVAVATSAPGAAPTDGSPVVGGNSPTGVGTTVSPTKKSSADKTFAAGGALACVMAMMALVL